MSDTQAPAVVAKCGWANGLAAIRSLGRAAIPVVALDYGPNALGLTSRYAQPRICPDPMKDEQALVRFLVGLADELGVEAPIFPTNDELLNAIGRNESALRDRYLCPFPRWDALGQIQSKRFQLRRAAELDIPHPRTAEEPTEAFGFPVLIKPSDPAPFQRAFGVHAFRCASMAELESAFERALPHEPLVQELIPGGDDELYTLGAYMTEQGEALGLFSGRKLRQIPPTVGTCRVGEAVWVDEVVEQGLAYLRGLGYHGLAQVEFKRDPRDGAYKLMEINPRLWQWHSLAAACGVDFPRIAYRDLTGDTVDPVRSNGHRKRWAATFVAGSWPAFAVPPYVDAVFARDDLRPGFVHGWRVARSTLPGKAIRKGLHLFRRAVRTLASRPASFGG